MENQDVYNIYRVYKEGYFGNEDRQSEMDPHRAHEYYGSGVEEPPQSTIKRPGSTSRPPYTIKRYSRDDAGRWEYGLLRGGKEIDSYIQRSRDTESDVKNYFIDKHNIDRSDIEFDDYS